MHIRTLEAIYFTYFLIPSHRLYQQDRRMTSEMDQTLFHVISL
jgi:hypothetical protein